jgi:hypothetical protein
MTTTVERFYVDHRYDHEAIHLEENYDLTVQLLRGEQRDAEHAGLLRRLHPSQHARSRVPVQPVEVVR